MNSFQESKNELEAAIRYAENAISSAQGTIESMEFRQEMAKKQYAEQTGREQALEEERDMLEKNVKYLRDENERLKRDVEFYTKEYNELAQQKEASSAPCGCQAYRDLEEARGRAEGEVELLQAAVRELESKVQGQYDDIVMLERDLAAETAQAEAWKKKYYDFKEALVRAGDPRVVEGVSGVIMNKPTMPVIPKAVAIAIFREGMVYGACNVCDELDNATDIEISDRECMGNFEVEYTQYVDLSDHLDLDYLRSQAVDNSDEEWIAGCLKNLCADNKFECRIHGVDDAD